MGLFKEIYCAECGRKTGILTRTKLGDGHYVCNKCTSAIPAYVFSAMSQYTLNDYRQLISYIEESNRVLKKVFRETHSFNRLVLDSNNGLLYVEDLQKRLYLKLEDLEDFDLQYIPDEVKEGFLSDKVTGKLCLSLQMAEPRFCREEVLDYRVKARAEVRDGLFRKKATYQNPAGMDEFLHFLNVAWRRAVNAKYERLMHQPYQTIIDQID